MALPDEKVHSWANQLSNHQITAKPDEKVHSWANQ
jgi:hypothetical protein